MFPDRINLFGRMLLEAETISPVGVAGNDVTGRLGEDLGEPLQDALHLEGDESRARAPGP